MIVFLLLLWGCQQTTNGVDNANDSWITGAVDRPSVTNGNQEDGEYDDDPEDQEEDSTETFAAYFAEDATVAGRGAVDPICTCAASYVCQR